mmetsp:Transcript_36385/g.46335  ORF Transcript_36385/g.46335 Transcript_36385/m.46335 type:complete len:290 (-) Transcript_36385:446-1315(-)
MLTSVIHSTEMMDIFQLSSVYALVCASVVGGAVTYFLLNDKKSKKCTGCLCSLKDGSSPISDDASGKKITLYGDPRATCTRKVIQMFEEKGYRFEFEIMSLGNKDQKKPEYMMKHPFGKVPLIEVFNGIALYESQAIVRYLNDVLPGVNFVPKNADVRAAMEKWISIYVSYFTPPQKKIMFERMLKPRRGLGATDEEVVENAKVELEGVLDVMEAQLAKTTYFAGDEYTLADLLFGPDFKTLTDQKDVMEVIEKRTNIVRWWNLCTARSAWKRTCEYTNLSKKKATTLV